MERFDLLIHGGTCVTPSGVVRADLGIKNGRIADLGALDGQPAAERFDASGLHLLPGAIDSQVHFREPGLTHKEDIGSGSACAALGGITCFFEMPNTNPNTDSADRLAWKVARARETSWVDFAFYVGATRDNADTLGELERLEGCAGVKVFMGSSTGTLLVDDEPTLNRVFMSIRRRAAFHSEDETRLQQRRPLAEGQPVHFHPQWRDEEVAMTSTRRLLGLARQHGKRVHVLHVTTAGELPLLQAARDLATFEVNPQHLTYCAPEIYDRLGTLGQMNPPIRDATHQAALWRAVRSGLADVLGSDHAPHTLEEKAKPYPTSPSGMPGVQTLLPVMLGHVAEGRLTLDRLVDLTAHGPARIFGLARKGRLVPGNDADVTVVDLKARRTITKEWSRSRVGWTPFEGHEVTGWPMATVVRGKVVMRDGALVGRPQGEPATFLGP
jgi:dihydroorotase